jgi:hypothetical protein
MSGSIENRALGAAEHIGDHERILTWQTCQAMLPLVRHIARDIVSLHQLLLLQRRELEDLDHKRRTLAWVQRARRYQLHEEIAANEANLKAVIQELEGLGLALLDEQVGLIGFPTLVNQRRAFFCWQPEEPAVGYWNYAGDFVRRPVPEEWTRPESEPRMRSRSRQRKK